MKSLLGSSFTIIAFFVACVSMFSGVVEMVLHKISWTVSGADEVLRTLAYALPLGILVEISYSLKEISHSLKQKGS